MENKSKIKRMTLENKKSFMHNLKCSFKSCQNIADYTAQFDDISVLPIATDSTIKLCVFHREEIKRDYPETKFRKILFVNGIQAYLICQRCGKKWRPYGFSPSTTTEIFGDVPTACVNCHSRAYQVKPE
jgi:hypothetical protein